MEAQTEFQIKRTELIKFLEWIDKSTDWKQNLDTTNFIVANEYVINILKF